MGSSLVRGESEVRLGENLTRRKFIHTTLIAGAVLSVPGLLLSSTASAADETQAVRDAFKKAYNAFNNRQPDKLSQCLVPDDPNNPNNDAELLKIHTDHEHPKIRGNKKIIDYLKNEWKGPPPVTMTFTPSGEPKVTFSGPDQSVATVTGLSCWSDNDGDGPDGVLRYTFKFRKMGGNWLIFWLSGKYTHNPPTACKS